MPQIDTVGYITTTAGTLAAGFAIGWLTGRFDPKFQRLQLDLVSRNLGAVDRPQTANPDCYCTLSYGRSEEHTSELQSLMRISYAVFCLKKKIQSKKNDTTLN